MKDEHLKFSRIFVVKSCLEKTRLLITVAGCKKYRFFLKKFEINKQNCRDEMSNFYYLSLFAQSHRCSFVVVRLSSSWLLFSLCWKFHKGGDGFRGPVFGLWEESRLEKSHMIAYDFSYDFSYDFRHEITWNHIWNHIWNHMRSYEDFGLRWCETVWEIYFKKIVISYYR